METNLPFLPRGTFHREMPESFEYVIPQSFVTLGAASHSWGRCLWGVTRGLSFQLRGSLLRGFSAVRLGLCFPRLFRLGGRGVILTKSSNLEYMVSLNRSCFSASVTVSAIESACCKFWGFEKLTSRHGTPIKTDKTG
jgi:hypothetical protein